MALKWIWESICRKLVWKNRLVLHATSHGEAEESLKRFPGLRTVVIPNGVDFPAELRHAESNGPLRLAYLGRLHPIKGVDALLDACGIIEQESTDWRLQIAGRGTPAYVGFLKSKVQQLGLSQRVEFLGEVLGDEKKRLFAQSDVAVVPSHVENFAIVVSEFLAHAVPVIASKGTPWKDLETNQCGLWVDNDPGSLAAAIRRTRLMPRREMGQRGREWMERDFSWESVSREMLRLYRNCAESQEHQGEARPVADRVRSQKG